MFFCMCFDAHTRLRANTERREEPKSQESYLCFSLKQMHFHFQLLDNLSCRSSLKVDTDKSDN